MSLSSEYALSESKEPKMLLSQAAILIEIKGTVRPVQLLIK